MATIRSSEDAVFVVFIGLIAVFGMGLIAAIAAVPIMLATGVLHGYWPNVPAFSFWQSLVLIWAWGLVWSRVKFNGEDS